MIIYDFLSIVYDYDTTIIIIILSYRRCDCPVQEEVEESLSFLRQHHRMTSHKNEKKIFRQNLDSMLNIRLSPKGDMKFSLTHPPQDCVL